MAYTTINKSTEHFNAKIYTGTGSSQSITGVGFQPDFTWIKQRSGVEQNVLFDAIRGVQKYIATNTTAAEATTATTLTAFNSDGFTEGGHGMTGGNGSTYASWNWKANGAGVANTDGSINSTVSVNTTAGFSIVKFTGTGANGTVGHGLGAVPKFIFGKNRYSASSAWPTYSSVLGGTKYLNINTTSGEGTYSGYWNNTDPTSSVISLGSHGDVNTDGHSHIYYCFAEKQGFSKFGSYVGNGNADGTFVYTGFKSAYVMVKKISASGNSWVILDTARADVPNANVNDQRLYADHNSSEASSPTRAMDLVSNGFKIRGDGGDVNTDGQTYIYMAFAKAPLVGSNNIPCTAR